MENLFLGSLCLSKVPKVLNEKRYDVNDSALRSPIMTTKNRIYYVYDCYITAVLKSFCTTLYMFFYHVE